MVNWRHSKLSLSALIGTVLVSTWMTFCFVQSVSGTLSDEPSPIRLVNGPTSYEGRVEVFYDGEWGSVCDDIWGINEAEVVCRQLGFNGSIRAVKKAFYGEGDGWIMLDNVQCIGNETALTDCQHNEWFDHNCFHFEDAGAVCEWAENTVRIHHDTGRREVAGRVEIYHNETWGTVCGTRWDMNDAEVVCRQVGFPTAANLISTANFNADTGPVVLGDVQCTGHEANLLDCTHSGWYNHSCSDDHNQDVAITCFDNIDEYDLRLVDENIYDNDYDSGRVQIFINGTWGSICSERQNINNAQVICRQLGYAEAELVSFEDDIQPTSPYFMSIVECNGNEAKLLDCTHHTHVLPKCAGESYDTFVSCKGPNIRLVGGPKPYEGRVEVLHHGMWGTICATEQSMANANLLCNQLGFDGAEEVILCGEYGDPTGRIMLSNLVCDEEDKYLTDCTHNGWFIHECDHSMDIGLRCDPGPEYRVRLVDSRRLGSGSSIDFEGRVEMYVDGAWGTVCDSNWDMADATVVCNQLGYNRALQAKGGAYFGQGSGEIVMANVTCNGHETYLSHCQHSGWYQHNECTNANNAGVVCDPGTDIPIRLIGSTIDQGVIETFYEGSWQTVCNDDDEWPGTYHEAEVVCRQLFHDVYSSESFIEPRPSDLESHMLGVSCGGWEYSLADCDNDGWGLCFQDNVPGVRCYLPINSYEEGDLRLVDGTRASEGRVEIYHSGSWGSICDTNWDMSEAEVVCRQLGYPDTFDATSGSTFGFGSGNIFLDSVDCIGMESRLEYCLNDGWGIRSCDVTGEAGVVCGIADGTLRLVHGSNMYEGRLEIHYQGVWGTICDALWGLNDAQVACGQLGYGDALVAFNGAHFGKGLGPVLLDYISCYGYEDRIDECPRGDWYDTDCDHSRDAGLRCEDPFGTGGNDIGFTNVPLILGVILAFLCILLWCYKPCCKLIKKNQNNNHINNDNSLNEISYPNDFSDFEILPDSDLPTYQDAASDLPPAYECLYGEGEAEGFGESGNNGLDNQAQILDESNTDGANGGNGDEDAHLSGVNVNRDEIDASRCCNDHNACSAVSEEDNASVNRSTAIETQTQSQKNAASIDISGETRNAADAEPVTHNEILHGGDRESQETLSPITDNSERSAESGSQNKQRSSSTGEGISETNIDLSRTQESNEHEMYAKTHDLPVTQISLNGADENGECFV